MSTRHRKIIQMLYNRQFTSKHLSCRKQTRQC